MKKLTKTILKGTIWVGRGTATVVGLAMLLALSVGLTSTALAGTGVGARFDLGKVNTVSAISSLVGSVAGPSLRIDNNSAGAGAAALDLRVEPGKPPMAVNSSTKVAGLNVDSLDGRDSFDFALRDPETGRAFEANIAGDADRLDGKDSTQFASGANGKANDANLLDGRDSTAFFSGKTYTKDGNSVDNPGSLRTAAATCDAGDVALSGGHRSLIFGAGVEVVSEETTGGTYEMDFIADGIAVANVTCADFPPLR